MEITSINNNIRQPEGYVGPPIGLKIHPGFFELIYVKTAPDYAYEHLSVFYNHDGKEIFEKRESVKLQAQTKLTFFRDLWHKTIHIFRKVTQ